MDESGSQFSTLRRVLGAETARLHAYLSKLPDDAWDHETACEAWDVATVVAHLAGAGKAFADRIRRGVDGDSSPPPGLPEPGSVNGGSWAETNACRWTKARQDMGDNAEVLTAFQESAAELDALLAGLDEHQWECLCYHPGGIVPVSTIVGFRLLEVAVHAWDIQVMLESSARLSDESVPHLLNFIGEYIDWFFTPSQALAWSMRFLLSLSDRNGVQSRSHELVMNGKSARIIPPRSAPHAEITGGVEAFVLAMCGRVNWRSAFENHDLRCKEGDVANLLAQWFKGA